MTLTSNTRNQLYTKLKNSHLPENYEKFTKNPEVLTVAKMIVEIFEGFRKQENGVYQQFCKQMDESQNLPSVFLKTNYPELVEFCAGNDVRAELLYQYLDKLNQFCYTSGWNRRAVRTKQYVELGNKTVNILNSAYHFQLYNTTLDKYLLGDLSEELFDLKESDALPVKEQESLIAAYLDAGDEAVKYTITKIITSENNVAFLTRSIICGIIKSNDQELHELLGKLLLAARLQEGVRQAICENMDCGTIEAFRTLFQVIDENNLIRYSSVRRAMAVWIGLGESPNFVRVTDSMFSLMRQVVEDKTKAYQFTNSQNAEEILAGLWGLGFFEVNDAAAEMEKIAHSGTMLQKYVAAYYNDLIKNSKIQQSVANAMMESADLDVRLAAGVIDNYMSDYFVFEVGKKRSEPISVNRWFENEETARKHLNILKNLLEMMSNKKYEFDPYIFPWYRAVITRTDVLIRMCAIANALQDQELIDTLAEQISKFESTDGKRTQAVRLLLENPVTQKRRNVLIDLLADREWATREKAFSIAKKIAFSEDEYDKICGLLRLKSTDVRLNLISLLKHQDEKGMIRSLNILLADKREEMRLAGLDLLNGLIGETEKEKFTDAILVGKKLAKQISNPTQREHIVLDEIFAEESQETFSENGLYTSKDVIEVPEITCDESQYPVFKVTRERLKELFVKLDELIEKHKDCEIETSYGQTVLLGNMSFIPEVANHENGMERFALYSVWESFYETEIANLEELMAMYISVFPHNVIFNRENVDQNLKQFDENVEKIVRNIFGKPVIDFSTNGLRYGNVEMRGAVFVLPGAHLFYSILGILVEHKCSKEYLHNFGKKVAQYVCCKIPKTECTISDTSMPPVISNVPLEYYLSVINSQVLNVSLNYLAEHWTNREQFGERFHLLLALELLFYKNETGKHWLNSRFNENLCLKTMDYMTAACHGFITKEQFYYAVFEKGSLSTNVHELFSSNHTRRWPYERKKLEKYGLLENEQMQEYLSNHAGKIVQLIVEAECRRGESPTEYSYAVGKIESFKGARYLLRLIAALGKDKLVRKEGYSTVANGSKNGNLCHLISVCYPSEGEDAQTLAEALKEIQVSEERLAEVAMYAPQWMELIEKAIDFRGLRMGGYYFMAHMNDQYNRDEQKYSIIANYTSLDREDLLNGAFDVKWCLEAYETLGEKRFQMLYQAAKYTSDGAHHTRARKYADAALGRVSTEQMEVEIQEKRNKDLLMSYPLIPLNSKEELLRRYQFIQNFRKESLQFGAQRRLSEGIACDMAIRNLAICVGFQDATRLVLAMETELVESMRECFEWKSLEKGKDVIEVKIHVSALGKPEIVVRKGEKLQASIPAAFKKEPYILELKECNKKFQEQYKRTVKMFELSMEEREWYTVKEIKNLYTNPVTSSIVENLVFTSEENQILGIVCHNDKDGLVDTNGEINLLSEEKLIRVAHPYDFYKAENWSAWQKYFFDKQKEYGTKQPFRQVFRELYVKLKEELNQSDSMLFAGNQIQPNKTVAVLKGRRWLADYEAGLKKIYYKENIGATIYALADWFTPSDIEAPTLEYVSFYHRKSLEPIRIADVPDIVYSEVMRDVDLAVSVAHAGSVDPLTSHSTIEMRKVIAAYNMELFGLENVTVEGNHAFVKGNLGEYTIHLGSGVVHMRGVRQLNVVTVHSQHRGKIFLPFLDEDPKTAEIISKIILFAEDKKIKDPYILEQIKYF